MLHFVCLMSVCIFSVYWSWRGRCFYFISLSRGTEVYIVGIHLLNCCLYCLKCIGIFCGFISIVDSHVVILIIGFLVGATN